MNKQPDPEMIDDENPEWTPEMFAKAKSAEQVLPAAVMESSRRGPGRPPMDNPKRQVTLRLDDDVLGRWRASGKGWQTRAAALLAKHAPR
ncbi:MAG: BrnA antitoxin family protein [Oceanococcaceae bacterium]